MTPAELELLQEKFKEVKHQLGRLEVERDVLERELIRNRVERECSMNRAAELHRQLYSAQTQCHD